MGDISRHRDIFLNTQGAIPKELLERAKVADKLGFIELGNFLTDVSQFRDPVSYIFAKRKVWRDSIVSSVGKDGRVIAAQALLALGSIAAAAALASLKNAPGAAAIPIATLPLQSLLSDQLHDAIAGLLGVDEWIDLMLGKPIERTRMQDSKRDDKEYGYLGLFFRHFIEGITQLLFAQEIETKVTGSWGQIPRLPEAHVTEVFRAFYTQYYPHEHTDQPPYVWDASERPKPKNATWYGVSTRQKTLVNSGGVMNAVDKHYIRYMAEGLTKLEADFRLLRPEDESKRRAWMVRVGKILHSVEDWFFHSNVVELIHIRGFTPEKAAGEGDEDFLKRFVDRELSNAEPEHRLELQRKLYRRLRLPVYGRGTTIEPAGIASTETSTLSLDHAYPAFPSQQDTAHTLLGALENLELKGQSALGGKGIGTGLDGIPEWLICAMGKFRDQTDHGKQFLKDRTNARAGQPGLTPEDQLKLVLVDVVREMLPLVLVLLYESERQRLVANVDPMVWPVGDGTKPKAPRDKKPDAEEAAQLERHKEALKPHPDKSGRLENNYERLVRYVQECGFLNIAGRDALVEAFKVDNESQKLNDRAPGAGGFLIQFALQLQKATDDGDAATAKLNGRPASRFEQATDNGAFNEIIGSHSLMSKDTPTSFPFFDDARVLSSLASLSVLHILLDEVSVPLQPKGVDWQQILWYFIRYPVKAAGWERKALAFFKAQGKIPAFADMPEFAELAKAARLDRAVLQKQLTGTSARDLEQEYIDLEKKVSHYRYPQ